MLDATITIFCQNEAARIGACVASLAQAAEGRRVHLTVITNGTSDDSAEVARRACRASGAPASLYAIPFGDKANAINHALHALLHPARLHVFVDGYAIVSRQTVSALEDALTRQPLAVAATGVAGNGRTMARATAETLAHGGRLHGQLHAFRPDFVARIASGRLRLPVGLYRGDGLLGSMACHDLDALGKPWDGHLIAGAAAATYLIPQLSLFRRSDIARQFRRKVRQMRGRLENAAIRAAIYQGGYAALPWHADDMIAGWLAGGGVARVGLADRPFMALAVRQHLAARRPGLGELAPVLVWEVG